MKIKYADVPKMETLQKLISVSFNTPRKNLAVYKFSKFMQDKVNYIENERKKLINKYGSPNKDNPAILCIEPNTDAMDRFLEEWNSILSMDIEEDMPKLPLSESDFETCSYSNEEKEWLNPKDIGAILFFCE